MRILWVELVDGDIPINDLTLMKYSLRVVRDAFRTMQCPTLVE